MHLVVATKVGEVDSLTTTEPEEVFVDVRQPHADEARREERPLGVPRPFAVWHHHHLVAAETATHLEVPLVTVEVRVEGGGVVTCAVVAGHAEGQRCHQCVIACRISQGIPAVGLLVGHAAVVGELKRAVPVEVVPPQVAADGRTGPRSNIEGLGDRRVAQRVVVDVGETERRLRQRPRVQTRVDGNRATIGAATVEPE